ncbi:RNA polymerase sigma factor [Methylosinus sp. Sm6]|uniref:RNA polymerase sigma factor n=1 Tax=Methylosinus sp. Sm6 TaxID=2866948 RepID=UPI001C99F53F|nr:RNA polymerase sigma factor [Methylosinus sp. Sm6]MBY6241998.1 RNA polymerase sigma factor [Methylosinus sp. Sm6]
MSDSKFNSIRELFARSQRDLLRLLARRVGHDDAPDLLQETFLRVMHRQMPETVVDPGAYLRRTAVNLAMDFSRRRRLETKLFVPEDAAPETPSQDSSVEQSLEAGRRADLLRRAIASLPPKCREVFVMRMHDELPQDEIARRLGISRNMVDRHLRIAIRRCRQAVS